MPRDIPRPPTLDSLELAEVLGDISADRQRRLRNPGSKPDPAMELVREYLLGAVRVPRQLGGGGYTRREFYEFLIRLSEADPDVPHILRIHYGFVEESLRDTDSWISRRWLERVAKGHLIGGASSELSDQATGYIRDTTLSHGAGNSRLNGQKLYSTGSWYCDHLLVTASGGRGKQVTVIVPAHREGISHGDDWDGLCARVRGRSTTLLENVVVHADEIVAFRAPGNRDRPRGVPPQLLVHAIAAGILRSVVTDTAAFLRTIPPVYAHGTVSTGSDDSQLLQVVGRLSLIATFVSAALLAAAEAQERAADFAKDFGAPPREMELAASLEVSNVIAGVEQIVLKAADELSTMREMRGSATTLDRHWRTLQTVFSRNPTAFNALSIGDLIVNGPPLWAGQSPRATCDSSITYDSFE